MHLVDESTWSAAQMVALLAIMIADTRYRRIPNTLAIAVWLLGCTHAAVHAGWSGVETALWGSLTGGALLLGLYLLRFIGAGDVKIFFALGAFLGPQVALSAALYGFLVGGVMAVYTIVESALAAQDMRLSLAHLTSGAALERARAVGTTIPLAAALVVGVVIAKASL